MERIKRVIAYKIVILTFLVLGGANTLINSYNKIAEENTQLRIDLEALARSSYIEVQQIDPSYSSILERRIKRHGLDNYTWFDKELLPPLRGSRVIVSSEYGPRVVKGYWHFHYGVDLIPLEDLTVYSSTTGKVFDRFEDRVYGLTLRIECEDYIITYSHLEAADFYKGDLVNIGDKIGFAGQTGFTTGLHLHYSIQNKTTKGFMSTNPFRNTTYGGMVNVTKHKDMF